MLRYLRRLADRDFALDRGMIPLGSCTMKLNATAEMEPITWPEFAGIHPFAPLDQAAGYLELIDDLERWLAEITGYDAVSLQPNAGSQGELAGLLAIRAYHRDRGEAHRDVCLIPSSAHGTNAASAVMAGLRVVVVACDDDGNVDVADLRAKVAEHADTARGADGDVSVDARCVRGRDHRHLRGRARRRRAGVRRRREPQRARRLARPGKFGADVSHLNLHKTFCIPHGGGGPASGRSRCAPTSRRTCRTIRCGRRPARRPVPARSPPRRGARPASCRSRGRTCG